MGKNKPPGTLNDEQIIALASKGKLITRDFVLDNVMQACYELRCSNTYYDLADGKKRYVVGQGEYILIKPKQLCVVITKEHLSLPDDILGRILTKGKLFSIGLLPVNTYADPGFYGRLGIVLYNGSNHFLRLNPGESLAKIEFNRLPIRVSKPYHGQHGYETEMWPIPTEMILSSKDITKDRRVKSVSEELEMSYGPEIARVIRRVFQYERYLILSGCLYFLFMILLLLVAQEKVLNTSWTIGLGIVANLTTALMTFFATSLRRRGKWN